MDYQRNGPDLMGAQQLMASYGAPPAVGLQATINSFSPWAYYPMDEAGSTPATATDASGNGRTGTYVGGTIPEAAALFSGMVRCREFSSGDRLDFPDSTVTADSAFSAVAFIKTTNTALQSVIGSDTTSSPGRLFQMRIAATTGFSNFVFLLPSTFTLAGGVLNDGTPHMFAVVYDPSLSAAAGRLKIYIDGAESARSAGSTTNSQTGQELSVGSRSNNGTNEPYIGDIGHCAFFRSALSAANISAIWAQRNTL